MNLNEIPELEGYVALTDAGRELGVTRQAMHKMIATDKIKTARRVGPVPVYIMQRSELDRLKAERSRPEPQ